MPALTFPAPPRRRRLGPLRLGVCTAAVLALMLSLQAPVPAQTPAAGHVSVLRYQWYGGRDASLSGTPLATFRAHMDFLEREGFRVAPLSAVRRMLDGDDGVLEKTVVIVIEGSGREVFEQAFPLLRQKGYPVLLFPRVRALDSGRADDVITWDELEQMHAAGADVGTLPYSNESLALPAARESDEAHRLRVREEILHAHRALQVHGIETDLLAFPRGDYTPVVISQAQALGYRMMFTRDRGSLEAARVLQTIPGFAVTDDVSLDRLAFELALTPLRVSDLSPAPGRLLQNPPPVFALRLREPSRYLTGVVNMFISEAGAVEADYDPATGRIAWEPERPLSRVRNRVTVTAKERDGDGYSIYARLYFAPQASP